MKETLTFEIKTGNPLQSKIKILKIERCCVIKKWKRGLKKILEQDCKGKNFLLIRI